MHDREGEFTRGERMVALDGELDTLREFARSLTKTLTGHGFDKHAHAVFSHLEDSILAAVFDAYLPVRDRFEQDVADDEAWERAEAAKDAA